MVLYKNWTTTGLSMTGTLSPPGAEANPVKLGVGNDGHSVDSMLSEEEKLNWASSAQWCMRAARAQVHGQGKIQLKSKSHPR